MKNNLYYFINGYLSNRPLFFSFLRPTEAVLMSDEVEKCSGKILDFGCGDGFFAKLITDKIDIIGLDLKSSRALNLKKSTFYQKIVLYDGKKIPLKSNNFDLVYANSVLEHIPNLEENLAEIFRVLKPGGKFIATVMTDNWEENLLGKKIFGQIYSKTWRRIQQHYHLYKVDQWRKIFIRNGFSIKKIKTYLPPKLVQLMEICHYLSFPSLLTHNLLRIWILFPNWYRLIKLDKTFKKLLQGTFVSQKQGAAVFFILKK